MQISTNKRSHAVLKIDYIYHDVANPSFEYGEVANRFISCKYLGNALTYTQVIIDQSLQITENIQKHLHIAVKIPIEIQ